MKIPQGTYTVLVTPFCKGEQTVDYTQISKWIDHQYNTDVAGLVLLGTTSESPTLSREEQFEIVKYVSNENKEHENPKILIVGVGGNHTFENLSFAKQCAKYCDGFMVTVPSYSRPEQHGIYQHFTTICNDDEITSKPVIIYNIPSRTGVNMEPKTIKNVYDSCKNIVAIKEASGNLEQVKELRELVPDLQIFSGDDGLAIDIIKLGGVGLISVASNVIPNVVDAIVKLSLHGDFDLAKSFSECSEFPHFLKMMTCERNPIPVKFMMHMMGLYDNNQMRLPMTELSDIYQYDTKTILKKLLKIESNM